MLLAAAPVWFADHVAAIAITTLVVLTILVAWVVQKTMWRFALLGIMVALALFVYVNREHLRACARTCECRIADRDLTVPACDPDLELGLPYL
jgi:hypothetical protein